MFGREKEHKEEEPIYRRMVSVTYTQQNTTFMEAFINKEVYENMTHKEFEDLKSRVIDDFDVACHSFQENVLNALRDKYPNLHFEDYVDRGGY